MSLASNSDDGNSPNYKSVKPSMDIQVIRDNKSFPTPLTHLDQGKLPVSDAEEKYHILSTNDVLDYVARTFSQWSPPEGTSYLLPGELVDAEEVGDGNLNLVFRLLDRNGVSRAVLKQSLPYVRCVGESWPLTLERNRVEADTLLAHYAVAPETTEKVLFHNTTMAVTVVEDLSDMVIWRSELVKGRHHAHVVPLLANYLARAHFFTSDFAQDPAEKKHAVQRVTNVDMCRITEDLFFLDPFVVHERNAYEPELEDFIESFLRNNAPLKLEVAKLKHRFMTKAEAHLHGDVHSGSVFIDGGRVKAIDAEFGFYGPIGFDVGTVVGNLLMNYIALPELLRQQQQQQQEDGERKNGVRDSTFACRAPTNLTRGATANRDLLLQSIKALWTQYEENFLLLAATPGNVHDITLAFPGYASAFLNETVFPDTVGFAGAEMIRRTIGLAHVPDLDGITCKIARLSAKERSLRLGATLILRASGIRTIDALLDVVRSGSYLE